MYAGAEAGNFNYYVAALIAPEGLFCVAPDGTGKLVPALAESWKQTSPTTYVYTIRQDARFSDGTAHDRRRRRLTAINLARSDPKASPNIAYYWANTKDVKATGDNEVTITLFRLARRRLRVGPVRGQRPVDHLQGRTSRAHGAPARHGRRAPARHRPLQR